MASSVKITNGAGVFYIVSTTVRKASKGDSLLYSMCNLLFCITPSFVRHIHGKFDGYMEQRSDVPRAMHKSYTLLPHPLLLQILFPFDQIVMPTSFARRSSQLLHSRQAGHWVPLCFHHGRLVFHLDCPHFCFLHSLAKYLFSHGFGLALLCLSDPLIVVFLWWVHCLPLCSALWFCLLFWKDKKGVE